MGYSYGKSGATKAPSVRIGVEFVAINKEAHGIFYQAISVSERDGEVVSRTHIGDLFHEPGLGLYIFPVGTGDNHKHLRWAWDNEFPNGTPLAHKAKWADNGFLYKEKGNA